MSKDLIIEIGTEELPARFVSSAPLSFKRLIKTFLEENRLEAGLINSFGTPRRIVVLARAIGEKQRDFFQDIVGPPKGKAFDSDGNPTRAAEGFARKNGVSIKGTSIISTGKGDYLVVRKRVSGLKTIDILASAMPGIISSIPFSKSMHWGTGRVTFARPVQWILAMFGNDTIPFVFGDIESGAGTSGHRFLKPGKITVSSGISYREQLRSAYVIVDQEERKTIIEEELRSITSDLGGEYIKDTELINEVSNLVEYPVVLPGRFDEVFLELPREVIINAMRGHQRYFAVTDNAGTLLPYFMTVANMIARDRETVIKGNERVLRARLNDAKFYFEKDTSTPFLNKVEELKGVVFHEDLGTLYDKVKRITRLALSIGQKTGVCDNISEDEDVEDFLVGKIDSARCGSIENDPAFISKLMIGRASMLAKADLITNMVREFPKLQGIMGAIYSDMSGEEKDVSAAIGEHYLPLSSGGSLPCSVYGALISLADKIDTVCGCFSRGIVPTGATDPYALRRQALGVVAIIFNKNMVFSLKDTVSLSLSLVGGRAKVSSDAVQAEILSFFQERIRNMLISQGYAVDVVDAVLSAGWDHDLPDLLQRVQALSNFKKHPDFLILLEAFKRVSHILKGHICGDEEPEVSLFHDECEKELYHAVSVLLPIAAKLSVNGDYETFFSELVLIKDRIDLFFDKVMVMAKDPLVRGNRLALLGKVHQLYSQIADMSRIIVCNT